MLSRERPRRRSARKQLAVAEAGQVGGSLELQFVRVQVHRGRLQVAVTQDRLDRPQVRAVLKQAGRYPVADRVGHDVPTVARTTASRRCPRHRPNRRHDPVETLVSHPAPRVRGEQVGMPTTHLLPHSEPVAKSGGVLAPRAGVAHGSDARAARPKRLTIPGPRFPFCRTRPGQQALPPSLGPSLRGCRWPVPPSSAPARVRRRSGH
jgi:hypothetical protein